VLWCYGRCGMWGVMEAGATCGQCRCAYPCACACVRVQCVLRMCACAVVVLVMEAMHGGRGKVSVLRPVRPVPRCSPARDAQA